MKVYRRILVFAIIAAIICTYINLADRAAAAPVTAATAATGSTSAEPTAALPSYVPTTEEVNMLAQLVWGEARGIKSETEQAAVVWCVMNRVDSDKWPDTVTAVITQKNPVQFAGYSPKNPIEQKYLDLTADVLNRWVREKMGETDVGRVLPAEYQWFTGSHGHNVFKKLGGKRWDWSLASPYEM